MSSRAGAAAVLARLHDAFTDLNTLPLGALTGDDVLAVLRCLEARNRLATADHALIAEAESRDAAQEHACPSTTNLLTQLLRISPTEAAMRVRAAADLGPQRGLTSAVRLLTGVYAGEATTTITDLAQVDHLLGAMGLTSGRSGTPGLGVDAVTRYDERQAPPGGCHGQRRCSGAPCRPGRPRSASCPTAPIRS